MTSSVSPPSSPFKSSFNILNPTTLFIAFSLGLHALVLWLVFPNINPSSFSRQGNGAEDVDLIELSEAERALLPDLSPESFDPDDFNIPLGNIPDTSSSSLEFDPLALQSALPNLPPPPPSLPSLNYSSNIPITITPRSLPSTTPRRIYRSRTNYPNYNRFRSSLPSPPPNLPLPPSTSSYNRPSFPQQSNRPTFDPIRQAIDPDDLINGRGLNSPIEQNNQDNSPDIAANTPNNRRTSRPLSPRQLTARQLQEERVRRLVAETQQNARGLRYDSTNTTNEEAMNNNVNWIAKVGVAQPKSRSLTGNYPKAACSRQLAGTAVYGVSVNPQGTITQPPTQIKSTGYGILDQQALSQIRSVNFANSTGQVQPYRVSVNFRYNSQVCGSRTPIPTQPTESTTQPSPNPVTPAPSISPKPPQVAPRQPNRNRPNVIQSSPKPTQQNQSPAPVITEETPKPIPPQETPNNQIIIEASPKPSPETVSPAPATIEKPSVKPSPIEETQQKPIETAPKPVQQNRPPAPSAIRKTPPKPVPVEIQPIQPTKPKPVQQNRPPAPSAVRKTPPKPVPVEIQPTTPPKPVQQNRPPAPSAVRKPSETPTNTESVDSGMDNE